MIDKEAIDIMAKTLYGEARGEGEEGLIAVGNVIKNRVKKKTWYGKTVKIKKEKKQDETNKTSKYNLSGLGEHRRVKTR